MAEKYEILIKMAQTIFENSKDAIEFIKDNGIDLIEQATSEGLILFDKVADSRFIDAIGILGVISSAYKGIKTVQERFFAKKMLNFVFILQNERQKSEKLDKALKKRHESVNKKNDKQLLKEVEILITTIDRIDRENKSRLVAKLYIFLLEEKIRYDQFDDMLKIIENLFESDEETLHTFVKIKTTDKYSFGYSLDYIRINRLISTGLLINMRGSNGRSDEINDINLTLYGDLLINLINNTPLDDDFIKMKTNKSITLIPCAISQSEVINTDSGGDNSQ